MVCDQLDMIYSVMIHHNDVSKVNKGERGLVWGTLTMLIGLVIFSTNFVMVHKILKCGDT